MTSEQPAAIETTAQKGGRSRKQNWLLIFGLVIAANIAAQFPEANPLGVSALIATGLALFVITLVVNMAARAIVARRKDFSGAN